MELFPEILVLNTNIETTKKKIDYLQNLKQKLEYELIHANCSTNIEEKLGFINQNLRENILYLQYCFNLLTSGDKSIIISQKNT